MQETFILLQQLLDCTTGIALSCIPYEQTTVLEFLKQQTDHVFDLFFEHNNAYWQQFLQIPTKSDTIYEFSPVGGITFLVYADKPAGCVYFLGPVLTHHFSPEEMRRDIEKYSIAPSAAPLIIQYCNTLPVVPSHILYRAADLVIGHLTGKDKPMNLLQANVASPAENYLIHQSASIGEDIAQMRQVEMRYEHSAALTDAIKHGNLSLALHMIGQYSPTDQTDIRNANPLRNAQNYCIVLNTQLRHALEASGIHPYRVDRLSNEIGLEIEQLKNTAQVPRFFQQIIRRYCRLVQEHAYPNLKPLTNLAVTYIKEHLTDNLTVKDTAKALTVNANYLSTVFHKEMGMNFIDFLNRERTVQAAALLKHTSLQIQQIASMVGYNNTSYFAKQFLRFHGISPSQYRRS